MAVNKSKWVKFKKFLKRNMTPTWAKHVSYQIFAFIVSVAMVIGVADYAVTKGYSEYKLSFTDDFTLTVQSSAFGTAADSLDYIKTAIDCGEQVVKLDIRQRPDRSVVISSDLVVTNNDGIEFEKAVPLLKDSEIKINLDIKDMRALDSLYRLLVENNLVERCFLTGIEYINVKALKESECANMDFYLNYKPIKMKVFFDEYRQKIIDLLDETGAIGINCNYKYSNSQLSQLLHKHGYKLSLWGVDRERNARKALVMSPDNITVKNPQMIRDVIASWGS